MKKTIKLGHAIVFASIFLFGGCKKGDAGPAGAAGTNGTANISSTTYPVSTWINGSSSWYIQLSAPALSSVVLNSAAVEVFFSTNNGTNWAAVPYTYVASTNYFMNFTTGAGVVEVDWVYNGVGNGSSPNSIFGTTLQFKVVVIPPGMIIPNVNTKNYDEFKKAYSLKD